MKWEIRARELAAKLIADSDKSLDACIKGSVRAGTNPKEAHVRAMGVVREATEPELARVTEGAKGLTDLAGRAHTVYCQLSGAVRLRVYAAFYGHRTNQVRRRSHPAHRTAR